MKGSKSEPDDSKKEVMTLVDGKEYESVVFKLHIQCGQISESGAEDVWAGEGCGPSSAVEALDAIDLAISQKIQQDNQPSISRLSHRSSLASTFQAYLMDSAPGVPHIHSSATNDHKPTWYFENGLRKVQPYLFQFSTFAKAHAVASEESLLTCSSPSVIKINGKNIKKDVIIRNGDRITNTLHRHEPPVTGDPVRILHRDDEKGLLVVEKPGSMPVHPPVGITIIPCCRFCASITIYHSFTVTSNRLDRLTSGVMVCALTVEASRGLSKYFSTEGAVKKSTLHAVVETFQTENNMRRTSLNYRSTNRLNVVHPEGKHAKTIFKKLSYDSESDLQCYIVSKNGSSSIDLKSAAQAYHLCRPTDHRPLSPAPGVGPISWKGRHLLRAMGTTTTETNAPLDEEPVANEDESVVAVEVAINELASAVILELRKARDIEDDFGRVKDTVHIDKAFKSTDELQKSLASNSLPATQLLMISFVPSVESLSYLIPSQSNCISIYMLSGTRPKVGTSVVRCHGGQLMRNGKLGNLLYNAM
ncbi:hypothetical protein KEM48_000109 [Puccinia striiformis f. sp. tritici PST-130]|nr:hypothetical protein KEM48_000109 [Puccinia striiformis f. sp. tritici PST-130]